MTEAPRIFDTVQLNRLRKRAAANVEDHDFLLRRVADDFAERLQFVNRRFDTILDLGAHHGAIGRRLGGDTVLRSGERHGDSDAPPKLTSFDPTFELLAQCSGEKVQGQLDALPFAESSFDLVVSGLSLHLVDDLPGALVQIRRILKPDGLFLGAVLGGATLAELRQAFVAAESEIDGGASPRVAPFADVRDLGSLLQRAGFALPVVDADEVQVAYQSPLHLMKELKGMGASNMLLERRRLPIKRAVLLRAAELYAERFSRPDGRVIATFEIITLTGWAPHESQQKPLQPESAKARLADALGVLERKT